MKSKYQQYKAYQLNGGTMSAQEWEADREQFLTHFTEMKSILDATDASYAE